MYFETEEESEFSYPLSYFDETLSRPFTLYEAIPSDIEDFFFCRDTAEVSEIGSCGRFCEGYAPRNGKSGICKHKGRLYTAGKAVHFK